jgi:hypothetical protein
MQVKPRKVGRCRTEEVGPYRQVGAGRAMGEVRNGYRSV